MKSLLAMIRSVYNSLLESMVINTPGPLGRVLRARFWRYRLKHMGRGVKIDIGVRIVNPEYVSIGDNTWIDNYVVILAGPPSLGDGPVYIKSNPDYMGASGEVVIGRNVHVANFVVIQGHGGLCIGDDTGIASGSLLYSMSHHHSNLVDRTDPRKYAFTPMVPRSDQSLVLGPIVIGRRSAIGLRSIVLPGVTVGDGSWVASGSVVSKPVPKNALAAGNPATLVKEDLNQGWSLSADTAGLAQEQAD